MDLETSDLLNEVAEVKNLKNSSTFPFLNVFTPILNFFPSFGFSVALYTVGLLVSWIAAGGNGLRFWGLAGAIALFWLVWFAFGRTRRHQELYYLTLGLVVILAILGLLTLPMLDDDYLRTNSISDKIIGLVRGLGLRFEWLTQHRNTLAGVVAVFGTLALAFTFFGRRWWERAVGLGAGLAMFGTLLATNGRGPLVAFGAGIGLLLILKGKEVKQAKWFFLHPYILLVVGALLAVAYITVSGQWRLFTPERLANENGLGRLELWENSLIMIEDTPLTGAGIGNFKEIYSFYVDPSDNSGRASQENTHNLFLQSYVEFGVAGFLAIGLATVGWVGIFWGILRKRREEKWRPRTGLEPETYQASYYKDCLFSGGFAAFGTLLVYSLTEYSAWYGQWIIVFWLPLALMSSCMAGELQEPKVKTSHGRKFRLETRFSQVLATIILLPLAAFIGWQLWGLVELNQAGLEKLRLWRGDKNASVEHVAELYQGAAGIVNWTGTPLRGLSWANLAAKNYSAAENSLQEGLKNSPNDKQLLLQMGDLKEQKGDHKAALDFWRKAKAAEVFYWRGRRWMDTDQEDVKAEPYFLRAIEVDQRHWASYEFLVMLYQRHSRTPDSIALLEKAVSLFPDNPRPAQMLDELKRAG